MLLDADHGSSFLNWLRISNPCDTRGGADFGRELEQLDSPLFYACFMGLLDVAKAMQKSGADVNQRTGARRPVLVGAALKTHESIMEFPLDCGADLNSLNHSGPNALHIAASNGVESSVALLLRHGAAIDAETKPVLPFSATDMPQNEPPKWREKVVSPDERNVIGLK